jgi:hypothetical protein
VKEETKSEFPFFNAGRFDKGLALRAAQHIARIRHNPDLLALQTHEWIQQQMLTDSKVFSLWERAVENRLNHIGQNILTTLQSHHVDQERLVGVHPKISPTVNTVFISPCPLCKKPAVPISRVDPEEFSLTMGSQLKILARGCTHRIPINQHDWQVILNFQVILREYR